MSNKDIAELRPEVFMKKIDLHGEIKYKYCIVNKNDNTLCALTSNKDGKMLPAVFNTKADADFYLSYIDEEDRKDCIIRFSKIVFFCVNFSIYVFYNFYSITFLKFDFTKFFSKKFTCLL